MIRKYRQLKKLSQEELAEEINISWRQLQRIEQNEEKTRITTFKKIVKVLNIPDNEIIVYYLLLYLILEFQFIISFIYYIPINYIPKSIYIIWSFGMIL